MLMLVSGVGAFVSGVATLIGASLARRGQRWAHVGVWRVVLVGVGLTLAFLQPLALEPPLRHHGGVLLSMLATGWVPLATLTCLIDAIGLASKRTTDPTRPRRDLLLADALGFIALPLVMGWMMHLGMR